MEKPIDAPSLDFSLGQPRPVTRRLPSRFPSGFTLIELPGEPDGATVSDRCRRRAASPVCFVRGEERRSSSATVWRPSLRRARHRAFTLIELLTVIAIIGVLAGILIPVIGRVRIKARASTSISNLRQIYLALTLHADENKDLFPKAGSRIDWDTDLTDTSQMSWAQQLHPYIQNKEIFMTPRFPREGSAYFLGTRAGYIDFKKAGFIATNRSRIEFPAQFVLAGETDRVEFSEPDFDKDDYTQDCLGLPMIEGKQAILFADGHVASFDKYEEGKMTFRYDSLHKWEE